MHVLQPKHTKIKPEEAEKLILNLNIAKSQLPKISSKDPAIPKDCEFGDIVKIERKGGDGSISTYYRVVI